MSDRWTIPQVSCPNGLYRNQDAFAAQWVGIDGVTNGTVEQLGTGEQCFEDQIFYYVLYDMFPNASVLEGRCVSSFMRQLLERNSVSAGLPPAG